MPSQDYSEEVQLEILDEIVKNQSTATTDTVDQDTTKTVDIVGSVQQWNYGFLLSQGYVTQEFMFSVDTFGRPLEPRILVGEKLTDAGRSRRGDLYERLSQKQIHTQQLEKLEKQMEQLEKQEASVKEGQESQREVVEIKHQEIKLQRKRNSIALLQTLVIVLMWSMSIVFLVLMSDPAASEFLRSWFFSWFK